MNKVCELGSCEGEPTYPNTPVIPALPSGDGGGHEFVTELPETGTPGVEYIVMGDPRDCSSFKGSYVWNNGCWVATSGAGGGALDTYTFEKTTTGWVAKKNGKVIFTYNDERITQLITDVTNIDNRVTDIEGDITNIKTQVTTNTTNININKTDITNIKNDIYGDYLKNRIAVCEDGPLTLTVDETNPQAKKLIICMDETKVGDKSDGAYQIKGQLSTYLSTSLLGTTPVNIVNVPDLDPNDIVLGETYLYDNQGTMGVVKAYDKTTGVMTVTTMTTSPGERSGVRLGSVELVADLPATITAAEGLGWLTPVEGDFAYVRDDDGKLAEYLVQSIDGSGNITWAFSHYINAGNYVVDILTDKGVLIPKNADGTVTLPVNDRIKTIYLADGTALPVDADYAVTLPDFIKGAVLKDGTVLPVNANKQIILPDFGTLKGVMTHDGTDLVIDANGKVTLPRYVKGIKDSDGNLLTMDVDDVITLPAPTEKYDNYEIDLSTKDIATDIDSNITVPVADITSILKKGATMTTAAFMADVTANRDLVFIHGLDGTKKTQEAIAYYVSGDANNLVFRVLAIPKAGSGGGASDKEVPEYTRDLHAGDVINHLELITYDNILYRMIDTAPYTLTGTWATDKTHFEVINSEAKNTYYNINRDGQELLSAHGMVEELNPTLTNGLVKFKKVSGSINQPAVGMFTVPAGKRVTLMATLSHLSTSGALDYSAYFCNADTSTMLPNSPIADPYAISGYVLTGTIEMQWTNDTGKPVNVGLMITNIHGGSGKLYNNFSSFTIQEIGRVVDPVAYLDNGGNAQEMPVGSLIQVMSNSAPEHYLICDGSEYTIGTYPELEAHFLKEFGSVTHFGAGAAANTYKVPDLRGEFLRMTGTNSHANQGNGAAVGTHQDATRTPGGWIGDNHIEIYRSGTGTGSWGNIERNPDKVIAGQSRLRLNGTYQNYNSTNGEITSRPTNTSVNVAIKCESTPRVVIDQGTYKASVKVNMPANVSTFSTAAFIANSGEDDTSMIDYTNNAFKIPVDGYYVVGLQFAEIGGSQHSSQLGWSIVRNGVNTYLDWSYATLNETALFKLKAGDLLSLKHASQDAAKNNVQLNIALVNTITDHKVAEMMLKPNLWTPGVEQSFGDGVYGQRFTGTYSAAANAQATVTLFPKGSTPIHIINLGGEVEYRPNQTMTLPGAWSTNYSVGIDNMLGAGNPCNLGIYTPNARTNCKYNVWLLYTKD